MNPRKRDESGRSTSETVEIEGSAEVYVYTEVTFSLVATLFLIFQTLKSSNFLW